MAFVVVPVVVRKVAPRLKMIRPVSNTRTLFVLVGDVLLKTLGIEDQLCAQNLCKVRKRRLFKDFRAALGMRKKSTNPWVK